MDLPRYCLVGALPVKVVPAEEGGAEVLAYDWTTGEFRREMTYLGRVVMPDDEVEVLSEAEFEERVRRLRASRQV